MHDSVADEHHIGDVVGGDSGIPGSTPGQLVETLNNGRVEPRQTVLLRLEIADAAVAAQRERGQASEVEARAESIAQRLGLEVVSGDLDDQNLVVPEVFVTDSTDPHIKKVLG